MHQNYLGSEWYESIPQEPFWSITWFLASMCALDKLGGFRCVKGRTTRQTLDFLGMLELR